MHKSLLHHHMPLMERKRTKSKFPLIFTKILPISFFWSLIFVFELELQCTVYLTNNSWTKAFNNNLTHTILGGRKRIKMGTFFKICLSAQVHSLGPIFFFPTFPHPKTKARKIWGSWNEYQVLEMKGGKGHFFSFAFPSLTNSWYAYPKCKISA